MTASNLSPEEWEAVSRAIEGGMSVPEAARRFGANRSAVYNYMARRGIKTARERAREAKPKFQPRPRPKPGPKPKPKPEPQPKPLSGEKRGQSDFARALPISLQAQLRPVDDVQRARIQVREMQEARVLKMREIVNLMLINAQVCLTTVDDSDAQGLQRLAKAMNALMPGGRDSFASILTAMKNLAETVRIYELSIVDLKMIEKSDEARVVEAREKVEAIEQAALGNPDLPDFTSLPTDELEKIFAAGQLLDSRRDRPTVPMPPSGPIIDHSP